MIFNPTPPYWRVKFAWWPKQITPEGAVMWLGFYVEDVKADGSVWWREAGKSGGFRAR